MNKILIAILIISNCLNVYSQRKTFDHNSFLSQKDTLVTSYYVYDYFRQEYDSIVFTVGCIFLMPSDSISFLGKNEYKIIKETTTNPRFGHLYIYFKNKLLYEYTVVDNNITGIGVCYYPFSGNVAITGQFNNGKLNGLVIVQRQNGEILEVMKYKKGKYIKHVYHWLAFTKKQLKGRSKNRSDNPLKGDELIIR